jgi:formamidopyrimidine-DNA glycosylase
LFFNDLRKFGWCKVLTNQEIIDLNDKSYGPEPFDLQFNADYLREKAVKIPNRKIKQFLLDQTIVAGIGNIYADEILFDTNILPTRKVKDINMKEWQDIVDSTIRILNLAISQGGTTDSDYVNAEGKKGGMQNYLKVYHKAGEKCANNCGSKIIRTTIGGRGTHYCESCQK